MAAATARRALCEVDGLLSLLSAPIEPKVDWFIPLLAGVTELACGAFQEAVMGSANGAA
jgi:hypothetical protein